MRGATGPSSSISVLYVLRCKVWVPLFVLLKCDSWPTNLTTVVTVAPNAQWCVQLLWIPVTALRSLCCSVCREGASVVTLSPGVGFVDMRWLILCYSWCRKCVTFLMLVLDYDSDRLGGVVNTENSCIALVLQWLIRVRGLMLPPPDPDTPLIGLTEIGRLLVPSAVLIMPLCLLRVRLILIGPT